MFTGIIGNARRRSADRATTRRPPFWMSAPQAPDSSFASASAARSRGAVAPSTVVEIAGDTYAVEAVPETLRSHDAGEARRRLVNLERPLALGERPGGPPDAGHVDDTSEVTAVRAEGRIAAGSSACRKRCAGSSCLRARSRWTAPVSRSPPRSPRTAAKSPTFRTSLAVTTAGRYEPGRRMNLGSGPAGALHGATAGGPACPGGIS